MDLALQEREHDLAIGTFGRAFYVLDDIRPLREFARRGAMNAMKEDIVVFDVADAFQMTYRQPAGMRFPASGGPFEGQNKYFGSAAIKYYVRNDKVEEKPTEETKEKRKRGKKDAAIKDAPKPKKLPTKIKMTVLSISGDTIRTSSGNVKKGQINTLAWDLRRRNPYPVSRTGSDGRGRFAGRGGFGRDQGGGREQAAGSAMPGDYKVHIDYNGQKIEKMVKVHYDPRIKVNMNHLLAKQDFEDEVLEMTQMWSKVTGRVRDAASIITKVEAQMKNADKAAVKDLKKMMKDTQEKFDEVRKVTIGLPRQAGQNTPRVSYPNAGQWLGQAEDMLTQDLQLLELTRKVCLKMQKDDERGHENY